MTLGKKRPMRDLVMRGRPRTRSGRRPTLSGSHHRARRFSSSRMCTTVEAAGTVGELEELRAATEVEEILMRQDIRLRRDGALEVEVMGRPVEEAAGRLEAEAADSQEWAARERRGSKAGRSGCSRRSGRRTRGITSVTRTTR